MFLEQENNGNGNVLYEFKRLLWTTNDNFKILGVKTVHTGLASLQNGGRYARV
jgi:hypothetical protein